MAVNGMVASCM